MCQEVAQATKEAFLGLQLGVDVVVVAVGVAVQVSAEEYGVTQRHDGRKSKLVCPLDPLSLPELLHRVSLIRPAHLEDVDEGLTEETGSSGVLCPPGVGSKRVILS